MIRTAIVLVACAVAVPAAAQPARPPQLRGIGLDQHLGDRVPLDLSFTEAAGRRVHLGDYFDGKRPVLLVLAYVRCKMLCSLVLHETTDAVRGMPLALDRDYRVVTVSIDPHEEAASANMRRTDLLREAGHPGETARWPFLVGAEHPIHALADALGFRYRWDPASEQFAHPAVMFVLTPDGRISRYLEGIEVEPATVASALRDAAKGTIGEPISDSVLSCFHFDPAERAHREQIDRFLMIGGSALILVLGSAVLGLYLWERR
ncbi:MAG: SCO family protein [Acidobacteriota bacterium]